MLRWSLGILALCVACGSSSVKPEQAKPAALVVDRSSVQFATVSPSETSAEASVRISNDGGTPTAALVTTLDGQDAGAFLVTSDGCRAIVLAPAATCDVHVAFRPSAEGQFSAELRVASDAAAATVALSGAANGGARLSVAGPSSFSGIELGMFAIRIMTVSNVGGAASSPISIDSSGDLDSFAVGGTCRGRALAPGESCDLAVTFTPQQLGPRTLSVDINGSRSESAHAKFDGWGQQRVTLTISVQGAGRVSVLGSTETCSPGACQLGFEIGGPVQNVTLTAWPGEKMLFWQWSGDCSGTAPSCSVVMDGDRSVAAKFAPPVTVTLDGRSVGGGTGTVALDQGTSCSAICRASALVPQGSRIRLTASPSASQVRWLSGCSGAELSCELTANADITATALFNGANYVFVSSQGYPTNLGIAAYDEACNQRAQVAGLPGPYVAWMSTSMASAASRVAKARGFIRVDGRAFADALGPGAAIYFPVALDELGAPPSWSLLAMTGSDELGQLAAGYNCSDWTASGTTDGLRLGDIYGGAGAWSGRAGSSCAASWPIYCIGVGIQRGLQREWSTGRIAFVSSGTFLSGAGLAAADALCAQEAGNAGLRGSFKALLAGDGASAASRFNLQGDPWVRPDGVAIVDKAADLGAGRLIAPIDVSANGAYDFGGGAWAWAGATSTAAPGDASSSCASWTSTANDVWGRGAMPTSVSPYYGFGASNIPCDYSLRVFCLQE